MRRIAICGMRLFKLLSVTRLPSSSDSVARPPRPRKLALVRLPSRVGDGVVRRERVGTVVEGLVVDDLAERGRRLGEDVDVVQNLQRRGGVEVVALDEGASDDHLFDLASGSVARIFVLCDRGRCERRHSQQGEQNEPALPAPQRSHAAVVHVCLLSSVCGLVRSQRPNAAGATVRTNMSHALLERRASWRQERGRSSGKKAPRNALGGHDIGRQGVDATAIEMVWRIRARGPQARGRITAFRGPRSMKDAWRL